MSVLVKGMEIPKEGKRALCLVIHADGVVEYDTGDYGWQTTKAVSVQPHGRLIDADALLEHLGDTEYKGAVKRVLMQAPSVIEAEEGEG